MLTELSQTEIKDMLANNYIGRIGCRNGDHIYIFPVNYVYEHDTVYCQSLEGAKVGMMRRYPDICFEVEEIRDFNQWKTVMAWGIFEELSSPADIEEAKQQLSDVLLAQKAFLNQQPPTEQGSGSHGIPLAIVYYRIRFNELSGRCERSI